MDIFMQVMWFGTGIGIVVAGLLAGRHRWARQVGRVSVLVLFAIAGGLMHLLALLQGLENTDFYVRFADTAHFQWVTHAWRDVFVPHQVLFVSVLAAFELTVGVLVVGGGRATQLGLAAAIAFHLVLWLFGGVQLAWALVILPFLVLLLRAERQHGVGPKAAGPARVGARAAV